MPCFSVIIPAYNRARFLPECLDSVLAQTFTDWECIVVDDGSTDGTRELVAEYVRRDARFRYHWQENAGASAARNAGIALATGEWIVFLDSDDRLLPWALACYRHGAESIPDAFVVVGRTVYPRSRIRPPDLSRVPVTRADYLPGAGGGPGDFLIHSITVRTSLLHRIPCFDQSMSTGEDTAFLLRLRATGIAAAFNHPVAVLQQTSGGKYARNIASGKRLDAEIRMYSELPFDPLFSQLAQADPARHAMACRYCATRVEVLEVARLLREARFGDAARYFLDLWLANSASPQLPTHLSRWFDHLFYPSDVPSEAGRRFGQAMRSLIMELLLMGRPAAARYVWRQLLACTAHASWRRLRHEGDPASAHILLAGLTGGLSPVAILGYAQAYAQGRQAHTASI
jgi:glycosyltransferase involved in cell wall biosynthesis